jgi:hypothetical protein
VVSVVFRRATCLRRRWPPFAPVRLAGRLTSKPISACRERSGSARASNISTTGFGAGRLELLASQAQPESRLLLVRAARKLREHHSQPVNLRAAAVLRVRRYVAVQHDAENQALTGRRGDMAGKRVGPAQGAGFGAHLAGGASVLHAVAQGAVHTCNALNIPNIQVGAFCELLPGDVFRARSRRML